MSKCGHEDPRYLIVSEGRALHSVMAWCPQCGALGDVDGDDVAWCLPRSIRGKGKGGGKRAKG